ncbi:MAG: DUF2125 domain-containing protein [Rhodobacteraceae bacterium]|nr:DUF2125 domain-containing protein [Paracoccaceae bacterium]
MALERKLFCGVALTALCFAQGAMADVTPRQVWNDLEAYLTDFGYAVTGTEVANGNDLTIQDMTFSMALPEGGGDVAMSASELRLIDRGDGSVLVRFPDVMPLDIRIDDGEEVDLGLDYSQTNMSVIVSGEPNNLVYTYTADSLEITLAELAIDGEVVPMDVASFSLQMNSVDGSSRISGQEGRDITQVMDIGSLTYDVAFSDPDGGDEAGAFRGALSGVKFAGDLFLPDNLDPEDPVAMMSSGFVMDGKFSHSGGKTQFEITEFSGTTNGASSTNGGFIGVSMGPDGVTYDLGGTGVSFNLSGPEIPLPVSAAMEEASFNVTMPLMAADVEQDFGLGIKLAGFTTADMLWGLFDPGQILPRDPATVALDITGKAKLFFDLIDDKAMMEIAMSDALPGELISLALNGLTVSAVGAELTGNGAFTFDNTDLETFNGIPRPIGQVNLNVAGANTLIDNLIRMGLLAEEDAMGARFVLSMFTVPGQGADENVSTIEFNEQGHILANGQRLQ